MGKLVIALVDAATDLDERLERVLPPSRYKLVKTQTGPHLLANLRHEEVQLAIVVTSTAGKSDGQDAASRIRQDDRTLPLILVSDHSSEEQAVAAFRTGVNDYLRWPCGDAELVGSITRVLQSPPPAALSWHRSSSLRSCTDWSLIGHSQLMREVKDCVDKASRTDSSVLITGETGTGKELVAQLIHRLSERRDRPFVCINCAAMPEGLLEDELFGHEKGAFTGASSDYEGQLRLADGGTAFFDEIGDMSPLAQSKILRVIETKEVYPLGGTKQISVDFRVIAATNRDVESMVDKGSFRKDLYYRLNVFRIHLTALRDHREDIPPLVRYQLDELNARLGYQVTGFDDEAMAVLLRHDWPGNVRELRNVVEAALVNRPPRQIRVSDLPLSLRRLAEKIANDRSGPQNERDVLLAALLSTNWNKSQAAKMLCWSRMTVYRKMRKYHITTNQTF